MVPKRKVGRPIAYQGDPDDSSLTDNERRRIKRRIVSPLLPVHKGRHCHWQYIRWSHISTHSPAACSLHADPHTLQANRESARRVRKKHRDSLGSMQAQVSTLDSSLVSASEQRQLLTE